MDKDFNANDSWDDGLSTSHLSDSGNDTHFSSWEDKKVQQTNKELDIIGNKLRDVEYLNKRADSAIVSVGEQVEKTKKISDDINSALPTYKQLSDRIDSLAGVVRRTFSNMAFTVAQSSYDEVQGNLSSIMDDIMIKSIGAANRRAKEIVIETTDEVMARIQKPMDEALARYDEQIKSRKEELKNIEKKAKGRFLTDGQLSFLIAGYAFFLGAAVWGLSTAVKHEGASGWVVVLLFVGLASNLIFYALKFAWKGMKLLWKRIPGNND